MCRGTAVANHHGKRSNHDAQRKTPSRAAALLHTLGVFGCGADFQYNPGPVDVESGDEGGGRIEVTDSPGRGGAGGAPKSR
jgi:hypothetical protein